MAQNSHENSQKRNRADHLEQYRFKPGDPRINRGGRPKPAIDDRLREQAERLIKSGRNKGKTYADVAVEKQWAKARKGDNRSFQTITERLDGKAVQRQEISGPDGRPFELGLATQEALDLRISEL